MAREDESLAAIDARPQSRGLTEIWVVWMLFGLATIAVFETYWRIPPQELWKVHNSGFVGGAGRALVFVGFSPALAAVAVLPIVADRLEDRRAHILAADRASPSAPRRGLVQTPSHLDPKWSNIWPVIGGCARCPALGLGDTARASRARANDARRATSRGSCSGS